MCVTVQATPFLRPGMGVGAVWRVLRARQTAPTPVHWLQKGHRLNAYECVSSLHQDKEKFNGTVVVGRGRFCYLGHALAAVVWFTLKVF